VYDAWRGNTARNRASLEELMYLRIFTEIACARFRWENLPETVDERFLELTLFNNALSVFFKHDKFDAYMALRAGSMGYWNAYDNPTSFVVYGNQEVLHKELAYGRVKKDCVPIWANYLRQPDYDIAALFSTRLSQLDRTIEINLRAYRKPFVVAVEESERLTFQNVMRQQEEGQAVIWGTQSLQGIEDKVKLLDMRIDKDLVLNLQVAKSKMWNECMTYLGINNTNQEKRERVVVSEVAANNSQVLMARNVALNARRQACKEINDVYGLNVSVDWNIDVDEIAQEREVNENVVDV
jgi:hypothetical protein